VKLEDLINIVNVPVKTITIPENIGISVNMMRRQGNVFAALEGESTKVENGNLFVKMKELKDEEIKSVINLWFKCLGFKHVQKTAVCGVLGDKLMHLILTALSEQYSDKPGVCISTLPPADETPYKTFTALSDLFYGTRLGVTIIVDYDILWNELTFIEAGGRKTPRHVISDLLLIAITAFLNRDVYRKVEEFNRRLFIPSIMYCVSSNVFRDLKGVLRLSEYLILTDYKKEDVEYIILYVDGTGFEKDEDLLKQSFYEWTKMFKNLMDSDIVYGTEGSRRIAVFFNVRELPKEKYKHIAEKCLSVRNMIDNPTPAIESLKFLGLLKDVPS